MSGVDTEDLKERLRICIFPLDNWYFDDSLCQRTLKEHFHVNTLEGLGVQDYDSGVIAAGALFQYLNETQKTALSHMATIHPYTADKFMLIDSSTRRNLELVETLREKQKRGSLLWVLDKTKTAMGARTLRGYVEQPLIDAQEINRRLAAVERKQLVQEVVEEKKIAFEEKKQAVALAVSKAQQKRQSEEAFRARMKKADQKKREEKIRKGNKK